MRAVEDCADCHGKRLPARPALPTRVARYLVMTRHLVGLAVGAGGTFTPPHRFEMGNARFLGGPAAVDVDYAGHGSHAKQRERIGQGVRDLADDLGAQRRGLRANGQRVGRVEPHALRAGGIRSEMTIVANLASGSAGTCPEELEHRLAHVPDWDLAGAGEVVDCVCAGHLGSPDLAGGDCPSGDLECKVHNSDRFRQARRLQ